MILVTSSFPGGRGVHLNFRGVSISGGVCLYNMSSLLNYFFCQLMMAQVFFRVVCGMIGTMEWI